MVDCAIRNGINYFDTAYVYHSEIPFQAGTSELFLGRALKHQRAKVFVATKLPTWLVQSRTDMDRYLNLQLDRLQTDHIDFYLVHSLTGGLWTKLSQLDVRGFLDAALADGRIRHAGFSFHDDGPQFKPIVDAYDWAFCQIQYNFMDEDYQAGRAGLDYAAGKGLGVIVMEPLRGGGLATRVPEEVQTCWDSAPVKRRPAAWALRFVWNHPGVSVVLSGMSEPWQLEENLRTAEEGLPNSLSAAELRLVQEARNSFLARTQIHCTSCNYCMPCPSGVSIPDNFEQYNNLAVYRDRDAAAFYYFHILGPEQRASHCTECGHCLELCPQHIPIPERLKDVTREFEG